MLYMCVFITLLSQMGVQLGTITSASVHVSASCILSSSSICMDDHGYLCVGMCGCWEYMLSFTAGRTWDMELHHFHLTQPIRTDTVYFLLAGNSLENTLENLWLVHL